MTNINIKNFITELPEIENSIKDAKLISIDLEFTALHPLKTPSLFDSPYERYSKLRINLAQVIPIQVGITTFTFNPNDRSYNGKMYNFYILPACFPTIQRSFYFQSDTLNFLKLHKFDFNELVYLGIPFINRQQETQLRERLRNETVTENQACCRVELEVVYKKLNDVIKIWYQEANIDDHLSLPEIYNKCKYNYEMLYFIQKYIRRCFKYLWTTVENNEFIVKLVSEHEYKILEKTINLEEELINNLLGFTRIFRLITSFKKPLIGHNLLQDILLLISSFETPLPRKYSEFKKLASLLFPSVFDTKSISYQLKNIIPVEKCWADSSLETLFEYFKNGTGRYLALNAPAIIITQDNNYGKFHEAGWDSFCAGYIFIRLAYLNIYHKFPKSKTFMSNELIGGLSDLKNRVNIIRGAVSYVDMQLVRKR